MDKKRLLAASTFTGAVAAAAIFGARFNPSRDSETRDWYDSLDRSPLNPPDSVFAPVWTALYAAMATSGYRIWNSEETPERRSALGLWALQLGLNGAWNPLFFGAKKPKIALADLLALLATQTAFVAAARKVDRAAAWLFAPYIAWVLFAGHLNAEIVRRNGTATAAPAHRR